MSFQTTLSIAKKSLRLDDEVHFLRSWMEKPLATGAVMPSGKPLARAMAKFVDPALDGHVIELGPGTGAVTAALVEQGVDPARLLRARYPEATVVQGDAYAIKRLLGNLLRQPAAAVVSGLPLFTKPLKFRLRLVNDAFALMHPGAPFVQFTYAVVPPIPRSLDGASAQCSERIWLNLPPARVWVYRRG